MVELIFEQSYAATISKNEIRNATSSNTSGRDDFDGNLLEHLWKSASKVT